MLNQFHLFTFLKPQLGKITVPIVNFIKPPPRNNIGVGQGNEGTPRQILVSFTGQNRPQASNVLFNTFC